MPIQNGRTETRQGHRYGDVMRVHEAAPKLIVQERVGERMKISSYCPVALLTRAGLALGWLQMLYEVAVTPSSSSPPVDESLFVTCHISKLTNSLLPLPPLQLVSPRFSPST